MFARCCQVEKARDDWGDLNRRVWSNGEVWIPLCWFRGARRKRIQNVGRQAAGSWLVYLVSGIPLNLSSEDKRCEVSKISS